MQKVFLKLKNDMDTMSSLFCPYSFKQDGPLPGLFGLYYYYTRSSQIKFRGWDSNCDLQYHKLRLYQLSHNHCQFCRYSFAGKRVIFSRKSTAQPTEILLCNKNLLGITLVSSLEMEGSVIVFLKLTGKFHNPYSANNRFLMMGHFF